VRWHEFITVAHMQLELRACKRVGIGIGDLGEDTHVAESPGRSLKVIVGHGRADLQSGRGGDVRFPKAFASRDLDGDQLPGARRHLCQRFR